jgi:hypothetical protein
MSDLNQKIITFIVGTVFLVTGEIVLYLITFGKHKVFVLERNQTIDYFAYKLSISLGGIVWIGTGLIIYRLIHAG